MKKTLTFERHDSGFRAIIFEKVDGVRVVCDILECDTLTDLHFCVGDMHSDVTAVSRVGEEDVSADCLSVCELATALMVDLRSEVAS